MADFRYLRLTCFLFFGLLLQGIAGTGLKRFEAILHFRELNHEALKQTPHSIEKFLNLHEDILADKLKNVFSDPSLTVSFFDIIESGEEVNLPTISVRAVITSSVLKDREEFVETFKNQIPQNPGLYLFAVRELEHYDKVDRSGVDLFQRKYAQKAAGECLNRGFMLPNNTCVCQPYYFGTDCSSQTCLNSGIISQNFRCSCPPGFIGRHCEQLACMAAYDTEFDFTSRSFVLVFNTKQGTSLLFNRVVTAISQVLPNRIGYYANYVLSVYYQDSDAAAGVYFSYTYLTSNYSDFINTLGSQVQIHTGGDNQPTLSAVNRALLANNAILPRSDVYVFVNSLLSDYDTSDPYQESSITAESVLTRTLLNWGHSVYTILAQNSVSPFNDTDTSVFTGFNNIATISNGEFVYVGSDTSAAAAAFTKIFGFNFYPETIAVRRGFDCTSETSVNVVAGTFDSGIMVYTTGSGITLSNGGAPVAANSTFGNFQVFLVDTNATSASLKIKGTDTSCSYRVFTRSTASVVFAYSRDFQLVDVSSNYPAASIPSFPVARIISLPNQISLNYTIVSINDPSSVLFNGGAALTNGSRSDCNFPLQFARWDNCPPGVFLTFLQHNEDDGGNPTFRARPSVCYKPTPRDPVTAPLNCNGGTVSSNNTCICTPYHSGNYCEITNCQNGGTANLFPGAGRPACYCTDGYSGSYCEQMICTTTPARPDTSRKAINVVFQSTFSTNYYIGQVSDSIYSIASGIDSSQVFDGFILTTFYNSSVTDPGVNTQIFNNISALSSGINGIRSAVSDDLQPQNVLAGLNSSLYASVPHQWQQVLFLIVDSPIGDSDLFNQVVGRAINLATAINVIITLPYGKEADSSISCIDDASTVLYQTLSESTGGTFVNLCNNVDGVDDLIINYGGLLYNFQSAFRQNIDCSSTVTSNIEANDGIQTRYLIFIGGPDVKYNFAFTDPSGNALTDVVGNIISGANIYNLSPLSSRGNYSVTISPVQAVKAGTQCLLLIGEPAGQTILTGFALNPSYDYNTLAAQFGQAQHPTVFISTQLQSPPTVSISISGADIESYNSVAVTRDPSTCQFDYYFNDVFSCPHIGDPFTINIRITTNDNVAFSRAIQSVCQGPALGQCLNGGSVSGDSPTICTCPPAFEGQFCEIPLCYNGGSLIQNQCQCPPGISGSHCEIVQCTTWNYMSDLDTTDFAYDTIAFIVNTNLASVLANSYLSSGITDFINNVNVKDHPKQFILTTYDDTNIEKVISTTDPRKFISVFQTAVSQSTGSNGLDVNVKSIDAIYETIKLVTYKPAIFFVFSRTLPATTTNILTINALLGQGGIQVNHIVTGQDVIPSGSSTYLFVQTALPTGGRILPVGFDQVSNLITQYLSRAIFENVIIEDQSYPNCFNAKWIYFPVENRAQWITITATGYGVKNNYVKIYDAANQVIDNLDSYATVNSLGTVSYTIPSTANLNFAGYWRASIETSNSTKCRIQVTANTPLQTDMGFTLDQNDDFPHYVSNTGKGNFNRSRYITVGVSDSLYQKYEAFLEYIKISYYDDIEVGSGSVILAAPFRPRDGQYCAYQYITPLFNIPQNGGSNTGVFKAQVNGQDEKGQNFQQVTWFMPQSPACAFNADTDEFGYCKCPDNYSGDQCTVPVCQNGGTADVAVCQCPSGYYGNFCEQYVQTGNTTSW